ncbi:MAG: DUF1553 domain-containing protein [Planctomycetaceae bacterium]|nr:DUF1553 domain-containing protein [Planctomycetaceae bacterium]
MTLSRLALFAVVTMIAAPVFAAPFHIEPARVQLDGNYAHCQLVLNQLDTSGKVDARSSDVSRQAKFVSSDPKVVTVSETGRVWAVANGKTTIKVTVGKESREMPVEVANVVDEPKISYAEQIVPLFGKYGCNQVVCHAAQYGKGGFKLSVFGYEPDVDYVQIVRDRQARRVNFMNPADSLILKKPSNRIAHTGGKRWDPDSVEDRLFQSWIACGAPAPVPAKDAHVTKIEVYPKERWGADKIEQQIRVVAHYSDGRQRDVTQFARYDSMDDAVVVVNNDGYFRTVGRGQAPVMVRFEGQAEISMVVVPLSPKAELADWKNNNFVDELAVVKFKELGITPSPLCDDATFVRRAYLDAIATLPTVEQATSFVASKDPQKRTKLIDELLGLTGDPKRDTHNNEYAAYWSLRWADLIRNTSAKLGEQGMWAMHNWIKESMRQNKPFDQFVGELITAKGSIYRSGPANYFRVANDPLDLSEQTAQLFLGVRLQCAKCHHHPFEKYSQDDYYGFAAYFARVGSKNSLEFGLFGRESVVMVKNSGEVSHPKTRKVMKPTPLEAAPQENESADRRVDLAKWLTAKDNRFLARNIANRYVGYLLGRGLVEPVDDMRATNPPTNPALLDRLAKQVVDDNFDVKKLMRVIMNSRLYQLESQPTKQNVGDSKFYSYFHVKRLGAEPLLDAIDQVTGSPTKFKNLPLGTRAIELPDADYPDYFLVTFGKPRRASVCECERSSDENLAQALHTLNGDTLTGKITDSKGRLAKLIAAKAPSEQIVTELYLSALSRRPSENELKAAQKWLAESGENSKGFYEDLMWSLVNSKQFLFIH